MNIEVTEQELAHIIMGLRMLASHVPSERNPLLIKEIRRKLSRIQTIIIDYDLLTEEEVSILEMRLWGNIK